MKANLITSRRFWLAVISALAPIVSEHGFGIKMSPEQVLSLTAVATALIGGLSYSDHTK